MATREQRHTGGVTLRSQRKGTVLEGWLSSTDHKVIGHMYLITSFFFFFCCAGIMALLIRIQLLGPTNSVVSDQQYNELFTMHGAIMLLLFATPLFVGFSNELLPLQIGAPDVAFPRLNLLSYYLFAFGGLILLFSFLAPGGAASFGWYAYAPLTSATYSPGIGADLWIMGLVLSGFGTILGAVNFITTIFCMRAPGMTMFRMPIFTWNALLTSIMVLLAFPVLAAALLVLEVDRRLGAQVFSANSGGAILWQNLFWFFGHPEVYILALPFFGIATEIIPVFSRKPMFAYKGMIAATVAIAGLSMTVWAHHMFTTGAVLLPFFSFMSLLIAVPTGIKFFNWAGTMWHGQLTFEPPMLYSIGFLVTFLFGGITGVILASPPMNFAVSDSYFIVAHFHYVLAGTVMFAMFAGFYFWWPKMTGKMLNSRLGKVQFWLLFIGFHMTFLVQHWIGVEGMPRRVANYPLLPGNVTTLNVISTVGSWILALSVLMFLWNVYATWRFGVKVTAEDPWGYCSSLEWATSCPPPRHNFYRIPRIRSERPALELHYPHIKTGSASRGIEQTIPALSGGQPRQELSRSSPQGSCDPFVTTDGRRDAVPKEPLTAGPEDGRSGPSEVTPSTGATKLAYSAAREADVLAVGCGEPPAGRDPGSEPGYNPGHFMLVMTTGTASQALSLDGTSRPSGVNRPTLPCSRPSVTIQVAPVSRSPVSGSAARTPRRAGRGTTAKDGRAPGGPCQRRPNETVLTMKFATTG
jgi:cytochrome c oxidase subunit 1